MPRWRGGLTSLRPSASQLDSYFAGNTNMVGEEAIIGWATICKGVKKADGGTNWEKGHRCIWVIKDKIITQLTRLKSANLSLVFNSNAKCFYKTLYVRGTD